MKKFCINKNGRLLDPSLQIKHIKFKVIDIKYFDSYQCIQRIQPFPTNKSFFNASLCCYLKEASLYGIKNLTVLFLLLISVIASMKSSAPAGGIVAGQSPMAWQFWPLQNACDHVIFRMPFFTVTSCSMQKLIMTLIQQTKTHMYLNGKTPNGSSRVVSPFEPIDFRPIVQASVNFAPAVPMQNF